jgi:hypothetical protein
MKHYYFTEKTKTALQNLLDWFISLEIGSPDLTWEVAGEKATTRHIIDYIKYIGKYTSYDENDRDTLNDIRKIYIEKQW